MRPEILPLLSVIVPVYNVEDYLAECLDSILRQTLYNMEILVIDDGSTDSSAKIIQQYMANDNRIKGFFKKNGGLSDARNFGLRMANGEYVTFIDSDDVLLNNDIYRQVISLFDELTEVDAIQYNVIEKWDSPYQHYRESCVAKYLGPEDVLAAYLGGNIHVSCCDKIFKSEIFKDIRFPKGEISEDIAIIPLIAANVRGIYISDIGHYGYRHRIGSISRSTTLKPANIYSILRSYNKYLVNCNKYNSLKQKVMETYSSLIWNYMTVMVRDNRKFINEFLSQPIFLKFSFIEWCKYGGASIKLRLKSFMVCIAGIRTTYRFQSIVSHL